MPQPLQASLQSPGRKPLGNSIVELASVDSTNNYAHQLLDAGLAHHGDAFFAHEQLKGKGQRGKGWLADRGSNILMSVVVDPTPLRLSQQFQLNAALTLGAHEFLTKHAGIGTKIKWPNDLYWQDRKAGGILIESGVGGREESGVGSQELGVGSREMGAENNWKWAIFGIGININQTSFPDTLPNPVSLKQITGINHDPLVLAKELCSYLDKFFEEVITNGFDTIYEQYNHHLYKKDQIVRLRKENRTFQTRVTGVSTMGQLITTGLIEERFDFGEIEWIIDSPTL